MEILAAATIAGGFTIVVALINRSDRTSLLYRASSERALDRIEIKLDRHLENHQWKSN